MKSFVKYSKNNLDYSEMMSEQKEILNKPSSPADADISITMFGTNPASTKYETADKEKTFSDIISDSESFIYNLKYAADS